MDPTQPITPDSQLQDISIAAIRRISKLQLRGESEKVVQDVLRQAEKIRRDQEALNLQLAKEDDE